MRGYDLSWFCKNKAFIHFDGIKDGKSDYGARICINTKGEKLFELPDREMFCFMFEDEDVAFVANDDGLYALMNNKGEFLTDFVYDHIYGGIEEGLFEVKRNKKHGHIGINGKEIIPCMYDDGSYFSEGVAAECLNGKWGMIDFFNNTVIPFDYEEIYLCKNNHINAKKNGKYGLINKNNEVVIDFIYDEIHHVCTRECLVYPAKKDDKWGVIDRYGNVIEDFIYDEEDYLSDHNDNIGEFIKFTKDKQCALYSTKEKTFLTDFIYDDIEFISENRFAVKKDDKFGFVDIYGELVVPVIYEKVKDFSEGLCSVVKDNKSGVIDTFGNVVIPFEYDRLQDCKEGMIKAKKGDKHYFINRNNNIVIEFNEDFFYRSSRFNNGFTTAWTKEQGEVYIDKTGKILEIKV